MDRILLGLGAAGAALLLIAIMVALWEQRRHAKEARLQRAWTDNTRSLLQAHAKDVDNRLTAMNTALQRASYVGAEPEGQPLRASQAVVAASAGAAASAASLACATAERLWSETEPMVLKPVVPDFDPTEPAERTEFSAH